MDFKFDTKALDSVVHDAIKDVATDGQRRLDRVHRHYAGKPVDQVEHALNRVLSDCAISPDKSQLRGWATLISQGHRIKFKV